LFFAADLAMSCSQAAPPDMVAGIKPLFGRMGCSDRESSPAREDGEKRFQKSKASPTSLGYLKFAPSSYSPGAALRGRSLLLLLC